MEPRSHSALRDLLPDYAANLLSAADRADVAAHLATCAECRAALATWRTLATWLELDEPALPPDTASARSLAAIHARLDHTGATASALSERNVDMPYQDDPGDMAGATSISESEARPGPRGSAVALSNATGFWLGQRAVRRHGAAPRCWPVYRRSCSSR